MSQFIYCDEALHIALFNPTIVSPRGAPPATVTHHGKEKGTQLIFATKNLTTLVAMLSDVAGACASGKEPRPLFFPGFTIARARAMGLNDVVRRLEQNPVFTPEEWQGLMQHLGLQ